MAIKELLEKNTDVVELATSLLAELNDREGQYVWKKCEAEGYYSYNLVQAGGNNKSMQVVDAVGFDTHSVDITFFTGSTGGIIESEGSSYDCWIATDGVFQSAPVGSSTVSSCPITYDPTTAQITFADWTVNTWTVTKGMAIGEKTLVGYVTADDEGSYPDGGVQDGYWYELFDPTTLIADNIRKGVDIWGVIGTMSEGVSGIDFGTVNVTAERANITVSHNLGKVPTYVAIMLGVAETNYSGYRVFINDYHALNYSSGSSIADYVAKKTANSITFPFGGNFDKFKIAKYYWIAIA